MSTLPELKPRINVWLQVEGEVALSHWRVHLLQMVGRTGSISAAAQAMDIQYRLAWQRIHEMEQRLGITLLESTAGGRGGGGSTLTPAAHDLIERFSAMKAELDLALAAQFEAHFGSSDPEL